MDEALRRMANYKKQHYLPSAYLKYFSTDQTTCNRDSQVWRFDGKDQRCVPVASQCVGDYMYSKTRAAETEQMFQISENAYCQCVDKIRKSQRPVGRHRGDLLLAMFDLYLRNAVHKNSTGKEGIDAYGRRVDIFISQILLDRTEDEITKSDIKNHLERFWRIEIISAPPAQYFVTSDNPSVWISLRELRNKSKPALDLITLPLTPKYTAVAFDRRTLEVIRKQATPQDGASLNIGQIQNAERCIYTSRPLGDKPIQVMKRYLDGKPAQSCEVDGHAWRLVLQHLPPAHHFSFMKLRSPLH